MISKKVVSLGWQPFIFATSSYPAGITIRLFLLVSSGIVEVLAYRSRVLALVAGVFCLVIRSIASVHHSVYSAKEEDVSGEPPSFGYYKSPMTDGISFTRHLRLVFGLAA